jgi:glycosyltransferase involved in cell wall biosynthesis
MRFVFISSRSFNKPGGIETYTKNLCQELAQRGHSVTAYCEGNCFRKEIVNGVNIVSFKLIKSKFFAKIYLSGISTIYSIFMDRNVDIYHFNALAAGLFSWIPRSLGKIVIYQGHGFEWQRAKWNSRVKKIIKLMDDFSLFVNNNITMVSENQSNYVKNRFKKNSITITPGVSIPSNFMDSDILKKLNLVSKSYFLYIGRLVEEKKADVLIDAFNLTACDQKLVIAGEDSYSIAYVSKLKKNASDKIIFPGSVFGSVKETLLKNCLAFCIPSELEGLSITLLEAMSHKAICIASDIPGNIEALGENGIYFKCNDINSLSYKLSLVIDNPESFNSLGIRNYERVKSRFLWEKITESYLDFIDNIYAKRRNTT